MEFEEMDQGAVSGDSRQKRGRPKGTKRRLNLSDGEELDDEVCPKIPKRQKREMHPLNTIAAVLCCASMCLAAIPEEAMAGLREHLASLTKSELSQWVLDWLWTHPGGSNSEFCFLIGEWSVCLAAFLSVIGMTLSTFYTIRKRYKEGQRVVPKQGGNSKATATSQTALVWLSDYANKYAEKVPDQTKLHLPPCLTKSSVYEMYVEEMTASKTKYLSLSHFYWIWRKCLSYVTTPKRSGFSKCNVCTEIKMKLAETKDKTVREALIKLRQEHLLKQGLERRKYHKHAVKGRSQADKYLSIIIDGMDQSKTDIPHFIYLSSMVAGMWKLRTHLIGAIVHGIGIYGYFDYYQYAHSSNLTIHVLLSILGRLKKLPDVLYLQLDNCARENKNRYILSLLCLLVEMKVFKKIKVSFLMVGHTHEDIDQVFSRYSVWLQKHPASTLPKLIGSWEKCTTPNPEGFLTSKVLNVTGWLQEYINPLTGHSQPHTFKIMQGGDGKAKIMYKRWTNDKQWHESGGNEQYLLKRIPDSRPSYLQPSLEKIDLERLKTDIGKVVTAYAKDSMVWWNSFFRQLESNTQEMYHSDERNLLDTILAVKEQQRLLENTNRNKATVNVQSLKEEDDSLRGSSSDFENRIPDSRYSLRFPDIPLDGKRKSHNSTKYICGSQFEGTTTYGMQSDIDVLHVYEDLPVVVDTTSAQPYERCLLMVQDYHTPAGYAKLQFMTYGMPRYASALCLLHRPLDGVGFDRDGRAVCTLASWQIESWGKDIERHGPAGTITFPLCYDTGDNVPAVRCRRWPDCAIEWLTRQRRYNWPDSVLFEECKSLSCFLVQVGHPSSDEKHLQWRISFSLQERLLVTHFNSTQLKCYILMKLIRKEIVQPLLQEKTITSYHCKTCLLYMIENTPASFWKEEHLLTCLYNCMKMILRWSENGVFPNYFIPDENMFDGRISGQLRVRLCSVLRTIISSDFKFLLGLKSDDLGPRLENFCITPDISMGCGEIFVREFSFSSWPGLYLLRWEANNGKPFTSRRLFALKRELLQTERVTEHTREETQRAISFALSYIDLSLMSLSIVLAKRRQKPASVIFDALVSDEWHEIGSQSDQFSAKLKQANYLCVLGYHSVSLNILEPLADNINQNLVSICGCPKPTNRVAYHLYSSQSFLENVCSVEEIMKHQVICVQFLQEEQELMPTALRYEITSLPRGTTIYDRCVRSFMKDTVFVDGKIFLYFLLYLDHRALDKEACARADIENIHWVIETDPNLGHKATALNLLGWIYKEMGRVDQAMECLNRSLVIQPQDNAAIRHIKDIESALHCMLHSARS